MDALTLMVCPHDTVRNPEGWYRLVQYLTARLEATIHFEMSLDFADFRQGMAGADLVYANPSDGLSLIDAQQFCPLARPIDVYDEALIVAGPEGALPAIEAIHGSSIASVANLLPTKLALKALRERGITPAGVVDRDSWLSVVRSVWNGEAPFGILYRDSYEELSEQGKAMVRLLESTNERSTFHTLMARPAICDDMGALTTIMTAMRADAEGQAVLADMQLRGWQAVSDAEIARMREVVAG